MTTCELCFDSCLESEARMLEALGRLLDESGVTGRERHRFMLVVSEAFNNALIHGNKGRPEAQIRLIIGINQRRLTADIIDQGIGGPVGLKRPPLASPMAENGRGLTIMHQCASSLAFDRTADGGLRVSIRVDRPTKQETRTAHSRRL